jgi:hypothetical protein
MTARITALEGETATAGSTAAHVHITAHARGHARTSPVAIKRTSNTGDTCISPEALDAMVEKSIKNTHAQKSVAYVKLHKAASTTVSAIMFRYAARHGLKILNANHQGGCWPRGPDNNKPAERDQVFQSSWGDILGLIDVTKNRGIAPKQVDQFWDAVIHNASALMWCKQRYGKQYGMCPGERARSNTIDFGDVAMTHLTDPGQPQVRLEFSDFLTFFQVHTPRAMMITSIREPLGALASFVAYFSGKEDQMSSMPSTKYDQVFLDYFEGNCKATDGADGTQCNHQARGIGVMNDRHLEQFEKALNSGELGMVIVTDKWVDSMLLLRKVANWEMIDVTSVHTNSGKGSKGINAAVLDRAKKAVEMDMKVYALVLKRFEQQMQQYYPGYPHNDDYKADKLEFKQVNDAVNMYQFYGMNMHREMPQRFKTFNERFANHPCVEKGKLFFDKPRRKNFDWPALKHGAPSNLGAKWFEIDDTGYEFVSAAWGGMPPYVKFARACTVSEDTLNELAVSYEGIGVTEMFMSLDCTTDHDAMKKLTRSSAPMVTGHAKRMMAGCDFQNYCKETLHSWQDGNAGRAARSQMWTEAMIKSANRWQSEMTRPTGEQGCPVGVGV